MCAKDTASITSEFDSEFQVAGKACLNALVFIHSALIIGYSKRIADLAIKNRLRSMPEGSD